MNPNETLASIIVGFNAVETLIAQAAERLAAEDAKITEEFVALFGSKEVHDAGQKVDHLAATLFKAKQRALVAHEALTAVIPTATFPRPRGGGK
jgi:hypothetical protein